KHFSLRCIQQALVLHANHAHVGPNEWLVWIAFALNQALHAMLYAVVALMPAPDAAIPHFNNFVITFLFLPCLMWTDDVCCRMDQGDGQVERKVERKIPAPVVVDDPEKKQQRLHTMVRVVHMQCSALATINRSAADDLQLHLYKIVTL